MKVFTEGATNCLGHGTRPFTVRWEGRQLRLELRYTEGGTGSSGGRESVEGEDARVEGRDEQSPVPTPKGAVQRVEAGVLELSSEGSEGDDNRSSSQRQGRTKGTVP